MPIPCQAHQVRLERIGRPTQHSLNTREKPAGFCVSPREFEKEVAGVLNTKDSAFQEALLKRGFLKKKKWCKENRFLPAG